MATSKVYLFDVVYDGWNAANLKAKFFERLKPFHKFWSTTEDNNVIKNI